MDSETGGGFEAAPGRARRVGLATGAVFFALLLALPAPAGLDPAGWRCTAVAALMAVWWITEAIPIPATALLPLALFPVLGVAPIDAAAPPYANPIVFLFMGGFLLAIGMQRWELHRRIALSVVLLVGTSPRRIVLGFLLATAFLSMWVSNTATAMMMLPIGVSVTALLHDDAEPRLRRNFGIGLALAIAYGANVGGLGTLIGTPPNALLAGFFGETYGHEIGFAQWMAFGVPMVLLGLPLVYAALLWTYPFRGLALAGGGDLIRGELRALGRPSRAEISVAAVFLLVAAAWIAGPLLSGLVPGLSDAGIAMAGALALFLIPAGRGHGAGLDWRSAERLPWGVLILFGGGLSLADAIRRTGLADYIGSLLGGLSGLPVVAVILVVAVTILLLTEMTSNTATAAAFLPITASLALGLGENPLLLSVAAALAASCAFMLPVGTPPNAIVFGSGLVTLPQMARAGVVLNLVFAALITLLCYLLLPVVFGVAFGEIPAWAADA